ncbi:hypothetical protein [Parapedobacter sp. DT-150]|uniref:hypothetical protein n=1 Tax=Parapedobacter sp. DT-150 TaxID=3396162 RepID=UPI003F1AD0B2
MSKKNVLFTLIAVHACSFLLQAQTTDETLARLNQYGNTYLHFSDRQLAAEDPVEMVWDYTYTFYPDRLEEKLVFSGVMTDSGQKYYEDVTTSTLYYKDILHDDSVASIADITRMHPEGSIHQLYIPVTQYHQREEVVLSHREGEAGKVTERNPKGDGTQFTLRCIGDEGKKKADMVVAAIIRMAKGIK